MSEYRIVPISKSDAYEINKVLIREVGYRKSLKNILMHMRKGTAIKLVHDGNIAGFCLFRDYQTHISLSYYYIYKEHRRKMGSFFFFSHCLHKMKGKQIYIEKNRNYELYEKYFKSTNKEKILQFKGLREDSRWVELLEK